jgi:membrane protein implicated in regulation of membrane protease activity
MPIGAQPRGARGTSGHEYSALNLRLALAIFGLVFLLVLAGILFGVRRPVLAVPALALAAVTVVDIVVIQLRRRRRRQTDPQRHSVFE